VKQVATKQQILADTLEKYPSCKYDEENDMLHIPDEDGDGEILISGDDYAEMVWDRMAENKLMQSARECLTDEEYDEQSEDFEIDSSAAVIA
jgi:hypothetical protein